MVTAIPIPIYYGKASETERIVESRNTADYLRTSRDKYKEGVIR
jgi:hypothetical protein